VRTAIRLGELDRADRALAHAPAAAPAERAQFHLIRGLLAAERWQLGAARAETLAALELDPFGAAGHEDMVRLALLDFDLDTARRHLALATTAKKTAKLLQGRSLNPSQSFIGQLVDEFALDPSLAGQLRALQATPPDERIGALRSLIRRHPGATAPAVALMVALRTAGLFDRTQAGGPEIPRTIVQYWNAAEPPPQIARLMQGWADCNPGHAHQRFDDTGAQDFLAGRFAPPVLLAYRHAQDFAQKSDLFRLAWLFAEGGVYADADDRAVAPLDALLPAGAGFVAYQEEYGTLANNFLAAAPRDPVIGRALGAAVAAVNRGDHDLLWLATGPGLMTRAFARELAQSPVPAADFLAGRVVLTRSRLARVAACHCRVAYKLGHHWSQTAIGAQQPTAAALSGRDSGQIRPNPD
jgi:hypothetical protein